jgi:hypothetical protein
MLEFKKNQSAFPPPKRIGKGEKFPSGWFGDLWNWIRSSRPIPDNVTIFGMPTANGIILSAKISGGGIGGGAAGGGATSDYSGYFTVISIDAETVKVVNGADEESTICGSFTAGSSNVSCIAEEIAVSGSGVVYLRIFYTASYQYAFGFAAILPSVDQEIYIALASIDDGTPAQVWTDGAITYLNGSYVL